MQENISNKIKVIFPRILEFLIFKLYYSALVKVHVIQTKIKIKKKPFIKTE